MPDEREVPQPDEHEEEEHCWMSPEQLVKCARADVAETLESPVPTRMVSNGEYFPHPQTEKQKRVEARIQELADAASKKLGISRRKFLVSSGGMAAAFLAMNEVFGRFFNVSPIEMFEPEAYAATGAPKDLFVLDDQLHTVRSSRTTTGQTLRAIAQGLPNPFNPGNLPDELGGVHTPWNPALVGLPNVAENFHLVQFMKDVYLDSQVTVGVMSNNNSAAVPQPGGPSRPPRSIAESEAFEFLTAQQTVALRNWVNEIAGSTRMLAHGQLYPGVGNLEYMRYQIEELKPDSWKGYNVARAAKVDFEPQSDMRRWRMDDEAVAYPMYELIDSYRHRLEKYPGLFNLCVHKGLSTSAGPEPELGHPIDIPKAARDWPQFNFIYYHACIRPSFWVLNALNDVGSGRLRNAANEVGAGVAGGVPDILWTTEFGVLGAPFRNVYAEIGTTFASTVITFPTVCAHILGQLLKFLGKRRIVFGSDAVWYGSPQWQIEALWRFEIPESLREQFDYPELTKDAKRRILGLNSARLYDLAPGPVTERRGRGRDDDDDDRGRGDDDDEGGRGRGRYHPVPADYESRITEELKTIMEFPGYASDNISKMRQTYLAMGPEPSNTRYGWIRTKA